MPRPAASAACTWSSRTSWRHAPSSSSAGWTPARSGTWRPDGRRPGRSRIGATTTRSSRSTTPTATPGSCRSGEAHPGLDVAFGPPHQGGGVARFRWSSASPRFRSIDRCDPQCLFATLESRPLLEVIVTSQIGSMDEARREIRRHAAWAGRRHPERDRVVRLMRITDEMKDELEQLNLEGVERVRAEWRTRLAFLFSGLPFTYVPWLRAYPSPTEVLDVLFDLQAHLLELKRQHAPLRSGSHRRMRWMAS